MLTKPPHGSPCNNCGLCCMDQKCPLGMLVFGDKKERCPALEPTTPGFTCGLVQRPELYSPQVARIHGKARAAEAAAHLIGAGRGCDALLKGEPPNTEWRQAQIADLDARTEAAIDAIAIWRT